MSEDTENDPETLSFFALADKHEINGMSPGLAWDETADWQVAMNKSEYARASWWSKDITLMTCVIVFGLVVVCVGFSIGSRAELEAVAVPVILIGFVIIILGAMLWLMALDNNRVSRQGKAGYPWQIDYQEAVLLSDFNQGERDKSIPSSVYDFFAAIDERYEEVLMNITSLKDGAGDLRLIAYIELFAGGKYIVAHVRQDVLDLLPD